MAVLLLGHAATYSNLWGSYFSHDDDENMTVTIEGGQCHISTLITLQFALLRAKSHSTLAAFGFAHVVPSQPGVAEAMAKWQFLHLWFIQWGVATLRAILINSRACHHLRPPPWPASLWHFLPPQERGFPRILGPCYPHQISELPRDQQTPLVRPTCRQVWLYFGFSPIWGSCPLSHPLPQPVSQVLSNTAPPRSRVAALIPRLGICLCPRGH